MSADEASSTAGSRPDVMGPVRTLQHALYRAAKADPNRKFHALSDKVYRPDVLRRAWDEVRKNNGAPGIDGVSLSDVEESGVARLLSDLSAELRSGTWRPKPARRVLIPKPGTSEQRPLSIPAVRDRVVQAAMKIVLEPIFEADFLPCSFGFRPRRSAHDALQVLIDQAWTGRRWVVETDIADCFSAIEHEKLIAAVEERVVDRGMLKLLKVMLRSGAMVNGTVRREVTGTPQGGVVSPLLANVFLHQLDRAWDENAFGVLTRYADDLVVMCSSEKQALEALAELTELLAGLGLRPKAAKTRIVHLEVDGGPETGFDFLGFHHRWVRSEGRRGRAGIEFLARWPSRKAMQHARDQIRSLTERRWLRLADDWIVESVNRFLRGWAGYFRYGNSKIAFGKIRAYALERIAGFVAKRRARSKRWGFVQVAMLSSDQWGLIRLDGTVRAPRPFRNWGP